MRKFVFAFSLGLIFAIPWEDSLTISFAGSISRLFGFIVAGLWFVLVLLEGKFRKLSVFHFAAYLFILWNLACVIWTTDLDQTIIRVKTYTQLFVLMLILWDLFNTRTQLIAGMQAYVLGSYISILSTILNYLSGQEAYTYSGGRYTATGVNAVDLVVILALGLPVAWYLFWNSFGVHNRLLKILNFLYIPLGLYAIFLTGSRTALFAILPAIFYIFWSVTKTKNRARTSILILLPVILVGFHFLVPLSVVDRLGTVQESIQTVDLGGRRLLWEMTFKVFSEHVLLGVGSGATAYFIGSVAHNTFLSVLAELGIVGFIIFAFLFTTVLYHALRPSTELTPMWLTILSIWLISVSVLSWEFRKPTWLFFIFIIIGANTVQKANDKAFSKSPIDRDYSVLDKQSISVQIESL